MLHNIMTKTNDDVFTFNNEKSGTPIYEVKLIKDADKIIGLSVKSIDTDNYVKALIGNNIKYISSGFYVEINQNGYIKISHGEDIIDLDVACYAIGFPEKYLLFSNGHNYERESLLCRDTCKAIRI